MGSPTPNLLLSDSSLTSYFGKANNNPDNLPNHKKTVSPQILLEERRFCCDTGGDLDYDLLTRLNLLSNRGIPSKS